MQRIPTDFLRASDTLRRERRQTAHVPRFPAEEGRKKASRNRRGKAETASSYGSNESQGDKAPLLKTESIYSVTHIMGLTALLLWKSVVASAPYGYTKTVCPGKPY